MDHLSVPKLSKKTTLGYGIGEFSKEIPSSILVFFLLYFLNNVAGLNAGLAGLVILVGKSWDAINDPMIGWLSDRTSSPRWGRRFPWIIWGALPLGLSFWLLLQTPQFAQEWQQFAYYCGALILLYTAHTAIAIPHATLGAELTHSYDERTQLISVKSAFSIGSSILGLVIAQIIFAMGFSVQERYSILGGSVGIIAILSALICVWATYPRYWQMQPLRSSQSPQSYSILQQFKTVLSIRPFVTVMGIYLCSWVGLQVTAAILQYYVIDYMGLEETHFTQMILAVQGTALVMMVFWSQIARRFGKRFVYCSGIPLTILALLGLFFLTPNQLVMMYLLGVLAGLGLSTAYLVPWAMLPDVIDLDELQSGQRREGIFCGVLVQLQKFGTAFSIFLVGKVLELSGYIAHQGDGDVVQPESAILAIRWLLGGVPALVLVIGIAIASTYSITRDRHQGILQELQKQKSTSMPS